ncbi:cholesterol 24-hydroxylase-like isoform X2 [Ambystoma mexicanum]|uniref:cholesterol 24-hydroxylase-like isoform X1 n=1 Tax=Ambystoma mexicanum TaxID=8296 RepID=UPI0037E82992
MDAWGIVSWLLLSVVGAAVLAFLLFCCYVHYIHRKYDHIPGPPRDSFFFGHLRLFMEIMKRNELIYDLLVEWVEKYGPVMRLYFLYTPVIMITSPEAIKEILMSPKYTKDKFYNRIFSMFGVRFFGNGLVTDRNYDHWHKQRRIMDPAFSRTYLMNIMGSFNEKAEELMEVLAEKADGRREVRMHEMMSRTTLDVIAKVAFGMELNALHDDSTPFPQAISMIMKGTIEMRNPFVQYMPGKQAFVKQVQESARFLRRTGEECIARRQRAIKNEEELPLDVLTQILKGAELEGDYDAENMVDNFTTFFIAGHETTANQLSFLVLELTRHPDVLKKLQAEIDEVIGSKRDVDHSDLAKLQYLNQALKEILRMYAPAPGTSRWLENETVIEGVRIPAHTAAMFNSYVMGRMEQYFKDPNTFDPDRFHPDAPKPYFSYFPFSLGPRSCIGQVFSQMEAKVVMVKLLQRFEFRLVPGQSFKIVDTGTLRPLDGVLCTLTPRKTRKEME